MNQTASHSHENPSGDKTRLMSTSLRRWFAVDLRSLAALRIALGSVLLADLWIRLPNLAAMYTDNGFFPRELRTEWINSQPFMTQYGWSLHCLSGELGFQLAMMGVAAGFAVLLLLGLWTRLAIIASWILLVSVHSRNSLMLSSGDTYLKIVLFWSMFLPIGEYWSIDRWRRNNRKSTIRPLDGNQFQFASPATMGLISVLFTLYFIPGVAKLNDIWLSGDAMEYVLRLDIYATDFGKSMLERPQLLKLITWATLAVEIVVPVLMVVFWPSSVVRYLALICFVGLHVGIATCMDIGLFPYTCVAIWVFVLPPSFWDRLGLRSKVGKGNTKQNEVKSDSMTDVSWKDRIEKGLIQSWPSRLICSFFVIYFLIWNISHLKYPACKALMTDRARVIGKALNMRQGFVMFDVPPRHSPWFVYEGSLANGEQIDLFRNKPVDHARPESVRKTLPNWAWRRVHRNLARPGYKTMRKPVSEYVLRHWNETHDADSQALALRTTAYLEEIAVRKESTTELRQVWFQSGNQEINQFDDLLEKIKSGQSLLPD